VEILVPKVPVSVEIGGNSMENWYQIDERRQIWQIDKKEPLKET